MRSSRRPLADATVGARFIGGQFAAVGILAAALRRRVGHET
jgi:hypothetical protein